MSACSFEIHSWLLVNKREVSVTTEIEGDPNRISRRLLGCRKKACEHQESLSHPVRGSTERESEKSQVNEGQNARLNTDKADAEMQLTHTATLFPSVKPRN